MSFLAIPLAQYPIYDLTELKILLCGLSHSDRKYSLINLSCVGGDEEVPPLGMLSLSYLKFLLKSWIHVVT